MKAALLSLLALPLAACGSQVAAQRPSDPPPTTGKSGPPPAWIETKEGGRWLGYSSWCWRSGSKGMCADFMAPTCGGPGIPTLLLHRGETVRAHLGYTPDEASVDRASATLDGRIVEWRAEQPGPFALFTKGAGNDASYVGCAVFDQRLLPAIHKCSRESAAGLPKRRCGALP